MSVFERLTAEYQNQKQWYKIAQTYFDSYSPAYHQISSYNAFMSESLPRIITNTDFQYTKDKDPKVYVVNFKDVWISKPEYTEPNGYTHKCYPQECRIRNFNYVCKIFATILRFTCEEEKVIETETFPDVYLGAIPCMIMSEYCHLNEKDAQSKIKMGECPQDPGGYFIINGSEKALMSQDRMAHETFVFETKKETIRLPIQGSEKYISLSCAYSAEVRSYSKYFEPNITTTYMKLSQRQLEKGENERLYMELPLLRAPVPWPVVFMALGVINKNDIIQYICDPSDTEMISLLEPSLDHPFFSEADPQDVAMRYLAEFSTQKDNQERQIRVVLAEKLFQNVPEPYMKRFYLGHMTHQLLATALGRRPEDDRDHYGKKRVETAGSLINNLFKSIWKRIIRDANNILTKKRAHDLKQIFYGKISGYIRGPFATGNWTAVKTTNKPAKVGVSQLHNRHNPIAAISGLRRVITPGDKNSKITEPRHLHSSQWAYICPVETPEGQSTGLIKNLSMLTHVSLGTCEDQVIDWLEQLPELVTLLTIAEKWSVSDCKVFVNGSWLATTNQPEELVTTLRKLRRQGKISFEVGIAKTNEGVKLFTDHGRVLAPFIILQNGQLPAIPDMDSWNSLVNQGIIEYLDPSELETLKHALDTTHLSPTDTHALLHPSFLLGISGNTAPFANHNQSPRIIYQAAMGKQALGVFASNFLYRYDTTAHILCYPQRPLVNTATMRLTGSENLPSGQNLVVAVLSAGYNQEDSVVLNQASVDMGLLRSFNYCTYTESNHRKGTNSSEICRPHKCSVSETRLTGYSKLDTDGLCKEGTPIAKRDVIIGKVNISKSGSNETVRDTSVLVKTNGMEENAIQLVEEDDEQIFVVGNGSAIIDQTLLTLNEDSSRTAKVRVRQLRVPQIGDKVASRLAQKGIIGMITPAEDMPFSEKTGMKPDLLMNPNAFPSRMTVGQAMETILGKACALNGSFGDCTAFEREFDTKIVGEELTRYGFEEYGDEVLINGYTGERMQCKIFMGPTFYQRLKHMVDDKIHARDQNGPRETLTRQPVEGRKRGGGFRMGEMETWCGISHGASLFLLDRLVNNSDGYEMFVCNYCGNISVATLKTQRFECIRCKQNTQISKVRIPYAFKLLMQELQAFGIGIWINVDRKKTLLPALTPSH
jgi:DNA-directed RNA polymerase II subunit RPB2